MSTTEETPFVSVIINTIDRSGDLRRCLNAVLKQSYRNFEIVVVNNGTGEETRRLLKDFRKRTVLANTVEPTKERTVLKVIEDKTKKLSYLFNVGWKSASPKASIFAYCADDTEPDKDWLKNIVDYLEKNPGVGAVSGPTLATTQPPGEMFALYEMMKKNFLTRIILRWYEYFVMEDKTFEPGRWLESGAFTMGAGIPLPHIKEPIEIELLTSGNMGIKRYVMEKINGFDENFLFNHADGDLFIRILKAGYKNIFHPQVKVLHHMRFGPTRFPQIMARDTAFYYLKDVRPKSLRGWVGFFMNLGFFLSYWIFKAWQTRDLKQLRGVTGFIKGVFVFFATNTKERNEFLKSLAVAALFVGFFVRAYWRIWKGPMMGYGDCWPFPETARQAFQAFFSAWHQQNPGLDMPVVTVISFLTFFEGVLITLLGGNAVLAQRLFHWLPLPLAFVMMYWALGILTKSRVAKFVASFIYSCNLVSIGELLGGYPGSLYVHAIFPVLVVKLYGIYVGIKGQETGDRKKVKKDWLVFSLLLAIAYIFSDHVLIIIAPFFILFLLALLISKGIKGVIGGIGLIFGSGVLVFLLTFPYTYFYLRTAFPFLYGESLRQEVLEFLLGNVRDSYRTWTLGDVVRIGGSSYVKLYGQSFEWAEFGYVLPLLAAIPLLFKNNWSAKKIFVILVSGFLSAVTTYFIYATHRYWTLPLFERFPILFRFRNTARPSLFLAFCYAPLIALTIDGWVSGVGRWLFLKKIDSSSDPCGRQNFWRGQAPRLQIMVALLKLLPLAVLIVCLFYYYKPFFSGDLTFEKNRGKDAYRITPIYYEIADFLNQKHEEEGFFRTLWLPWNHEEALMKLRYLDPYTFSVPINYGAYKNSSYTQYLLDSYRALADEETGEWGKVIGPASVRYIVLNLDSKETGRARAEYGYQTPYLLGAAGDYRRILDGQKDLNLVKETEHYRIYENFSFEPIIGIHSDNTIQSYEFSDVAARPWRAFEGRGIRYEKTSPTSYTVFFNEPVEGDLILGEAYDPQWQATIADGKILGHFEALGWANGYRLDGSEVGEIHIEYTAQKIKDILVFFSFLTWLYVLASLLNPSVIQDQTNG